MHSLRRAQVLSVVFAVCSFAATASSFADFDFRSIFVDRFDFSYSSGNIPQMTANIHNMMQAAADQGFNHVVWQVRGRGDALYNSNFEPPISNLTPGFDPLQVALDAAHSRGLKLHAWLNTTPMWNTTAINPPAGHIYHNTNPSFRLMDINGNLEPQQGWSNYSSVNPILPEVHDHINNVVNDIATNYAVDGIHLDYIRYLPGANNAAADFAQLPHDPISHQMFFDATGLDAGSSSNFAAYKNYITGRITDLVASIKDTVDAAEVTTSRTIEYSASVWRDPDVGKNDYMQDYRTWIEQELLDVAMPMIYLSASNDGIYFNANLANTLDILDYSGSNTKVVPNLASYLHINSGGGGVALTLSQMQRAYDGFGQGGTDGVSFYDYPAFFNGYSAADRQQIKDFFTDIDTPPTPPGPPGPGNVIDDFEVDEGHFGWAYDLSPQTDGLAGGPGNASAPTDRVTTEHQGLGTGSQLLNLVSDGSANWQLRHNSGIGAPAQPADNVPLQATGFVGYWLKTDDPGVTTWIGIDDPVGNTALEFGTEQDVIADNQWHLYQWNFEDADDWIGFAGGANGRIDNAIVTIDSIWFAGSGDVQIYLDTVSHNPNGILAAYIPGDYDRNGLIEAADYDAWLAVYGANVVAGREADGNGDGVIDVADYVVWRKIRATQSDGAGSGSAATPEPGAFISLVIAGVLIGLARRGVRGH